MAGNLDETRAAVEDQVGNQQQVVELRQTHHRNQFPAHSGLFAEILAPMGIRG